MGSWLADVVRHDAWALWLATPAVAIALVCLGVWWWSRPARPASTTRSIEGHRAYLDALAAAPRERVPAPVGDLPAADVEPLTRVVVHDADTARPTDVDPGPDSDALVRDSDAPGPTAEDVPVTVTLHA